MILKCDLIEADKPTINKRVYTTERLTKAVAEYNQKFPIGRGLVTVPSDDCTPAALLNNAVAMNASPLELKDGKLQMDVKLLGTPKAKALKDLLEASPPDFFAFYPVCTGEVRADGTVEDCKIISFSIGPVERESR